IERLTRNHALPGGMDVRHNLLFWLLATGTQASQGERRAHELQKAAATHSVMPFRGGLREFALYKLLKRRTARQFFEAAPVLRPLIANGKWRMENGEWRIRGWACIIFHFPFSIIHYLWHVEHAVSLAMLYSWTSRRPSVCCSSCGCQ